MTKNTFHIIACALTVTQAALSVPVVLAQAVGEQARQAMRPEIVVNRTVPFVSPARDLLELSDHPTDEEIFRARVFTEPLVPVAGTSVQENQALSRAIIEYARPKGPVGVAPLEEFIKAFPVSSWRPSLLANLGEIYLRNGRPSQALAAWEAAWQGAKNESAPLSRAVADLALGNWLDLMTHVGNVDAIEGRLQEIEGRDVGGAAGSKVQAAREGLWILRNHHEFAVGSGPTALNTILSALKGAAYVAPPEISHYHTMPSGTSLTELRDLSKRVGLKMQMAERLGDAPIPVPAVVHYGVRHYAAIVNERGGRYLVRDLVFGGEVWITGDALLQESSGFFLIPEGKLSEGWRPVSESEGTAIIGHCAPGYPDDEDPGTKSLGGDGAGGSGPDGEGSDGSGPDSGSGGPGGPPCVTGMPSYSFIPNKASLRLSDIPVGCTPPRGPASLFRLSYDHREGFQPQMFSYWNAGPKWTFDWLSFVMDQPDALSNNKWVYLRGGGREQYGNNPHWRSAASLMQVSTSPIRYERRLRNGATEVFTKSDGATSGQRRVFLTEIIDPKGQSLTFTYDGSLRLVAATDALGQVTTISYELGSDPLKVTSVEDPFGRMAHFSYNAAGQLSSVTDVIGLTSTFSYANSDFVAALTTPYGTTAFRHEPNATSAASYRMIEATDPLGGTEHLEFRWTTTDIDSTAPSGEVPTGFSSYNASLQKYNSIYWDKRAWSSYPNDVSKAMVLHWLITPGSDPFAYHGASSGIPHSIKRPLENRVWYAYASQGDEASVGSWIEPTKIARVLDDTLSQVSQATYNSHGMVTSITDPAGRETNYAYAGNGIDLLEVRQAGGVDDVLATYSDYTVTHRPETMVDAAGETSAFTYNSAGQLLTATNPKNETTTYNYDSAGYLTSVTGPVTGATITYGYDDYGRLETVTDSEGYAVTTEYDLLDRPIRVTYPDDSYEEIDYIRLDPVSFRDRAGRSSRVFYDALRRMASIRDSLGRSITMQWCVCGDLQRIIDGNGHSTSWTYDLQGRVVTELRSDGASTTTSSYESTTSRLKSVTDPVGQVKHYAYEIDNRILEVSYTNETIDTHSVVFTYDPDYPRRLTMVDGAGTTTYSYKAPGDPGAGKTASIDGPFANDTIAYAYDELSRVDGRSINAISRSFDYDSLGRLSGETNGIGTFDYSYVGSTDRLHTLAYPNSQLTTYNHFGHGADDRLQTILHTKPDTTTLSRFDYAYDASQNISTWRQQVGAAAATDVVLAHDARNQLVGATRQTTDVTPTVVKRFAYGYDLAGNRTSAQVDDAVTGATYDELNHLANEHPNGALTFAGTVSESSTVTVQGVPALVTPDNHFSGKAQVPEGTSTVDVQAIDAAGNPTTHTYEVTQAGATRSFTYDANGSMTSDGTRTFEWDAANRLVRVLDGETEIVAFVYDGLGRRVQKVADSVTTSFIYDGIEIAEERRDGTTLRYTYGPRLDQVLATQDSNGVVSYFVSDHLGSIARVTDESGDPILTSQYDMWGNREGGTVDSGPGFAGTHWDDEGGLNYARARYYDPKIGRFLSEDPIRFGGGANWSAYADNGPDQQTDPLGLCSSPTNTTPTPNLGSLAGPDANPCENKIRQELGERTGTSPVSLGPTKGSGMAADGMRNGAYNYDYFLPGVTNPYSNTSSDGRFPDSGLHIPPKNGDDPVNENWGPGTYNSQGGFYVTAHRDSANPRDDVYGFLRHVIGDVLLRLNHGC